MTLSDEERQAIQRTAIDQAKADSIEGRIRSVETDELRDEVRALIGSIEAEGARRARKAS